MEDRFLPAAHLLGDALPAGLAWRRPRRRAAHRSARLLAGVLLAALGVLGLGSSREELVVVRPPAPIAVHSDADGSAERVAAFAAEAIALAAAEAEPLAAEPVAADPMPELPAGEASYYARGFEGRPTASGEPYRAALLTAAHRTLPFGTTLRVTNPRNGRSVVVRVNDRGPFHPRRVIDLSRAAAAEIGIVRLGRAPVRIERVAGDAR